MPSLQEATSLLEQSLQTRRALLGQSKTGVTREALDLLAKTPSGAPSIETREARLTALREAVSTCRQCPHLADSRTQTVFGTGNPHAELMFVGEAPGADEDQRGEPFVGAAGELLTKIIGVMGLSRENIYIANVLKCRPDMPKGAPGNRPPSPPEMQNCLPYLREQIAIIQPRAIVALGKTAMAGLTGAEDTMSAMRGRWFSFEGIPLLPTFHPSYLLRNGSKTEKRKVWEDMMLVMEKLAMPISEKQRGYFLGK